MTNAAGTHLRAQYAAEREARAWLPSLLDAPTFTARAWHALRAADGEVPPPARAAGPFGLVVASESLAHGTFDELVLVHVEPRWSVTAERAGRGQLRLAALTVEVGASTLASHRLRDGAPITTGRFRDVDPAVRQAMRALVEALLGAPRAALPLPEVPTLRAVIEGALSGTRCSLCRKRIEALGVQLGHGVGPRPAYATSPSREAGLWHDAFVPLGGACFPCAAALVPAELAEGVRASRWAADPRCAPYVSLGARLTGGPLVRCAACRGVIRAGAPRIDLGRGPLDPPCARSADPAAYEAALASAPAELRAWV